MVGFVRLCLKLTTRNITLTNEQVLNIKIQLLRIFYKLLRFLMFKVIFFRTEP